MSDESKYSTADLSYENYDYSTGDESDYRLEEVPAVTRDVANLLGRIGQEALSQAMTQRPHKYITPENVLLNVILIQQKQHENLEIKFKEFVSLVKRTYGGIK